MVGLAVRAEDPRGNSAHIASTKSESQHQFKSRRRYEAIEKGEAALTKLQEKTNLLSWQLAQVRKELSSWESWWARCESQASWKAVSIKDTVYAEGLDEAEVASTATPAPGDVASATGTDTVCALDDCQLFKDKLNEGKFDEAAGRSKGTLEEGGIVKNKLNEGQFDEAEGKLG